MAAIVTDSLKKIISGLLLSEVQNAADSDEYYVGIGKSDAYNNTDTPINPVKTLKEEREARNNIQSFKKITASSLVVERYNWSSGAIYEAFDDTEAGEGTNPYYVLTEENQVYVCLQQGKNTFGQTVTSTVKPNYTTAGVSDTEAFETSDGYRWKFLYQLSANQSNNFLSANYFPVTFIGTNTGSLNSFQLQQLGVENASISGQILGIEVTNVGSGYTSAPSITIQGNGSNAAATATLNTQGGIAKIEMNNESAALGSGYTSANIVISGGGGSGALARAVIGPLNGITADARDTLKANKIMLHTKPSGSESGAFIVNQDFRQITVFRNITAVDSDTHLSANAYKGLNSHRMTALATSFTTDKLIRGTTSDAAAFIDEIDSDLIFFHQNENTGFKRFIDGEIINESDGTGSGTIDSANLSPLADPFSGELLYVENRADVFRTEEQQEDIKIVISV